MLKNSIVVIVSLWSGILCAQTDDIEIPSNTSESSHLLDLRLPASTTLLSQYDSKKGDRFLLLASAEGGSTDRHKGLTSSPATDFEERSFTGNKIHKYLGLGTIGAALLTVLAPKGDAIHESLAEVTTALAAGTVATGLIFHYEDIGIAGGFSDPDNIHALSAGIGAIGIALATSTGPDVPHATFGSLGMIGMLVGVKYTW